MDYRAGFVSLAGIDDLDLHSIRQDQPAAVTRLASASSIEYGPIKLDPALIRSNHPR